MAVARRATHNAPTLYRRTFRPQQNFKFFEQQKTWEEARKHCHTLGAGWKLATVHSRADNAAMTATSKEQPFWIGFSDHGAEGAWTWDIGEDRGDWKGNGEGHYAQEASQSSYVNWAEFEPNNAGAAGEHCAHAGYDGQWRDHSCSKYKTNVMCSQDKFKFVDVRKTWAEARDHCAAIGPGWSLAVIMDAVDQRAVARLTRYETAWIGYHDDRIEGDWVWDGYRSSNFGYFKGVYPWMKGEPNNAGTGEDCALMKKVGDDVMWNDSTCSTQRPFVCSSNPAPPDGLWWRPLAAELCPHRAHHRR